MRFLKFAVLAALLVLPVSTVSAGILGSVLTFDGVEDTLVDDSSSNVYNVTSGTLLSDLDSITSSVVAGDEVVIFGQISISDIQPGGAAQLGPNQIAVLFSAQVDGLTQTGALNLGPTTAAGFDLASLVDPAFAPVTNGLGDAIAVVVSHDGSGPDPFNIGPGGSPGDLTGFAAGDFELDATIGFATGSDDFFHFGPVGNFGILGSEAGGFSILDNSFAPGAVFLGVEVERFDGTGTSFHDVTLEGSVSTGPPGSDNGFTFGNDSDLTLNAVPEPGSIMSFVGLVGLGMIRRCRRKQA